MKYFAVLCILLFASVTDYKKREVPYIYIILLILTALIDFRASNMLGCLLSVPFYFAQNEGRCMGGGDVLIVAALGFSLGLAPTLVTVIIADFVVIDCSCHLSDDILSTMSLIEADCVLRLINCDLKSISYLSSQLPLLADSKFRSDRQLKVANDVKSIHSRENIEQIIGGVSFTIPHSDLVEKQYLEGELLKNTPEKRESKEFRVMIEDIAEEVFDLD